MFRFRERDRNGKAPLSEHLTRAIRGNRLYISENNKSRNDGYEIICRLFGLFAILGELKKRDQGRNELCELVFAWRNGETAILGYKVSKE